MTYSIGKGEMKMEKLIIDGNAIYELDLECVRKKQGKKQGMADLEKSGTNDFGKKIWKNNTGEKEQCDLTE